MDIEKQQAPLNRIYLLLFTQLDAQENATAVLTTFCFINLFVKTNSIYLPRYLKSVSAVAA